MWPALMSVLDEGEVDSIAAAARYLDVTLAVARDVLIAHHDPAAVELPSYSSEGAVSLHRPVIDDQRRREADDLVHEINRNLDLPWPDHWSAQHLIDTIISVPPQLNAEVRQGLRRVFRLEGFESPPLVKIVDSTLKLVGAYRAALSDSFGP
jgi:hypothetical protein